MAQKERPGSCWTPLNVHNPSPASDLRNRSDCPFSAAPPPHPCPRPALDLLSELLGWFLPGLPASSSPPPPASHAALRPERLSKALVARPSPGGWRPGLGRPFSVHSGLKLLRALPALSPNGLQQCTRGSLGAGHGIYSFLLPSVQPKARCGRCSTENVKLMEAGEQCQSSATEGATRAPTGGTDPRSLALFRMAHVPNRCA